LQIQNFGRSAVPIAPPKPAPAAPLPKPVPAPAGVQLKTPVEETAPWEAFSDTHDPRGSADTAPQATDSARRLIESERKATSRATNLLLIVLAAVTLPFFIVVSSMLYFFWPSTAPTKATGPQKLIVTQDDRPGRFTSVGQALAKARTGDIIELQDEQHFESLIVNSGRFKTEVTLQAAPGKKVVWRPKPNSDDATPVIKLYKAAGFSLKGQGITIDGSLANGKGKVKDAVEVTLFSPGLVVEDLQIQNFGRSAVTFANAAGTPDQHIGLSGIGVQLPPGE
jgi:hypothetical protein